MPIDARPPGTVRLKRALRLSWTWESTNRPYVAAASWWAARALRRAGPLDGVVALSSSFVLGGEVPTVTFEDITVVQARRQPFSPVAELGERSAGRWRRRQERVYASARACCVASAWAARSIRDDYGVDPDKIHVIGFGCNFAPERPAERDWSVPRFIFIGIDWERKGGPAVLEAFAALRERLPDARLDIVGGYRPAPQDGVQSHGRLSFADPGQRAPLEALLARATCLVLPSEFEPFGIAYADAGAAGVPSIGTTEGGAADAIGAGGLLVPPADSGALQAAMLELSVPERAQELGARALENSNSFTWELVAERILEALQPSPSGRFVRGRIPSRAEQL